MLIYNNQLTNIQLHAVDILSASCRAVDGGIPTLYRHILEQKRVTENNILYYQNDNLVGFLSVYFFYTDACEISLMVAPTHRRQGIAKQLLQAIMPLLIAKQMNTLIFSTPTVVNEAWLSRLGLHYQSSEYQMQRNSYEPILITKHALTIRKATVEDISALCDIDALCFAKEHSNMPTRFTNLMDDSNYTLLLALHDDEAVGKAHLRWQTDSVILSDIAIIPRYQGQGWGSELLAYCINHVLTLGKTKLLLDVETSNHNALSLYTRHGFKLANASDYWTINIDKLRALVST